MLLQYNNQYYIQPVVSGPGRRGVAITKAGVLGHDNLDGVSSSPEVSPDVELANHHVMVSTLWVTVETWHPYNTIMTMLTLFRY